MPDGLDDDPRAELEALTFALGRELRRRAAFGVRRSYLPADGAVPAPTGAQARGAGSVQSPPSPPSPPSPTPATPNRESPESPRTTPRPRPQAPVTRTEPRTDPSPAPKPRSSPPASPAPPPGAGAADGVRARAAACSTLEELREAVAGCRACSLCESRKQTVFADGQGHKQVMFVGEAPGYHEDVQGVPFVGRAGQLLTDIIEKGMGLTRADVTICNVLKCRPPDNRDPSAEEKALCTPWLDRQIELADPRVIIPLGRHAAGHLLGTDVSMGRLRGRVHERQGRKVVPTYHPAFLLRSPHMKRDCWQDIQLAMRELGLSTER